ncbi:hypothetical protein ABPG75_010429 [Micractinium tetrahymenae]
MPGSMTGSAPRRLSFLLGLCCAASLLSGGGSRGTVHAATVLSEDDARWLMLLQPAARSELPGWLDAHDRLAGEVEAAKEAGVLDVVVYGDSIMEAFRGECLGADWSQAYSANMAAWKRAFEGKRAGIFAICGDQAVHLLWRLKEGEGPAGLNPRVVTVMIGTNDAAHLSNVYPEAGASKLRGCPCPAQACGRHARHPPDQPASCRPCPGPLARPSGLSPADRQHLPAALLTHPGAAPPLQGESDIPGHIISLAVQQVVRELQRQVPQATIVVFGLLPLQPQMLGKPDREYDGIIAAANKELAAFVEGQGSPRLVYKDCGGDFLLPSGEVDSTRMPDGVHPAGEGGELLLKCMLSAMKVD